MPLGVFLLFLTGKTASDGRDLTMENKHTTAHLLAVLTIIIWGTTFISTKILLMIFLPLRFYFFVLSSDLLH